MSEPRTIITFTNLFPSPALPQHGLFVRERMQRVVARLGCAWRVVCPVPSVPWWLRRGEYARVASLPAQLHDGECEVRFPRYRHLPGFGMARQAARMAEGARAAVHAAARDRRAVLDAHYVWPDGVAAARLAGELGLPFTITARGTDVNVLARDSRLAGQIRSAAAGAYALLAVSDALCARFAEVLEVPRERVRLARNGVDLERFRPGDAHAARAELGLPQARRLLLGVGRLVPGKGFHLLAETLAAHDVDLVLIGAGPERRRLARELPRTRLLGALPQDRVAIAYRACDLLVLPSEREGWPNVVTEALASGLPVVATSVGGIPQIVSEPRAGRLVPPGDAHALADAVGAVLAAPPARADVRAFAERFGWDEPVGALAGMFAEALR